MTFAQLKNLLGKDFTEHVIDAYSLDITDTERRVREALNDALEDAKGDLMASNQQLCIDFCYGVEAHFSALMEEIMEAIEEGE